MKINYVINNELKLLSICVMMFISFITSAQQGTTVTGTVVDKSGTPLIGVNVIEYGTTNGTITDIDGGYSLQLLADNASLVYSYVGFSPMEKVVDGRSLIDITLLTDSELLNDVVIVGYGTRKKSDLTGAVSSVNAETLTERNFTNPLESVQGNIAGVQISNSTGRLGDGFDVTIRGKNTFSGNTEPLYVVDGVPTDNIDFLNPQDIAQIDVLKDASSTSIYGSRGSNGVLIVTTKSGSSSSNEMNISFESFVGTKKVARLPQMMDGATWWDYHRSAYLATATDSDGNGSINPEELRSAYAGSSNDVLVSRAEANEAFDWYDAVLQDGFQNNNYLSINGRSDNGMAYNLGFGYQNETGNIVNESLDKYTLKAGLTHNLNDKFSAGINLTFALNENQLGSNVAMREAFRLNPFLTPFAIDDQGNQTDELFAQPGKLTYPTSGNFAINKTSTYNPLLEIANSSDEIRRINALGNIFLKYAIKENLTIKTALSPGLDNSRRGKSWGVLTNRGISNNNLASSEMNRFENFNYTWDNQIDYSKSFGTAHKIDVLGLQSIYSTRSESLFASSRNQPFETAFYNIGSGDQSTFNVSSNFVKQTLASYATRLNYSFNNKYLVTISNRWDGSSLFADGNKWDYFPSAAVAWKMNEEDFLSGINSISQLKLRVSYGFTGNNIIDPYSTLNTLDGQTFYDYNGNVATGFVPTSLANSELTWEKTKELNFGVDFAFFNYKLNGSLDLYNRESNDLLFQQRLPIETGFDFINANIGSVKNSGVELALNANIMERSNFSWDAGITFTKNNNEILSLNGQDEVDDIGNNLFIGESIDAQYNFQFDGIWQADEADLAASYNQSEGQGKVVDINNDGKIDPDDDRIILGSANPDWTGSFFTSVNVGKFDFSTSMITSQGSFVFSPFHQNFTDTRDRGRQKLDIPWYVPANEAGLTPQASNEYPQPRNVGTYWRNDGVGYYRDVSFVKVKNIAVGYNFDESALNKVNIQRLRVFANVLNPFVFSDYDGYDPEWADASLNIGRVSTITYQFGVNVQF